MLGLKGHIIAASRCRLVQLSSLYYAFVYYKCTLRVQTLYGDFFLISSVCSLNGQLTKRNHT